MSEPTKVQEDEVVGYGNEVTVEEETPMIGPAYKHLYQVQIELRYPINRGKERVNYHLIEVDDLSHLVFEVNGGLTLYYQDDGDSMVKTIPSGQWIETTTRSYPPFEMPPEPKAE